MSRFLAFLRSHGQPLLDLSFYVSTQNYVKTTRPAYTAMLPYPARLILPPRHRGAARLRSHHLGLSALEIDDAEGDRSKHENKPSVTNIIPPSLLTRPKESVTSLLSKPEHAKRARLEALIVSFLEPLARLLGDKPYLLSRPQPSSLDCLTLGYLSLAMTSGLPQPWLAQTMRSRYAGLCNYVERLQSRLLAGTANPERPARDGNPSSSTLPWSPQESISPLNTSHLLLETFLDSFPVLKDIRQLVSPRPIVVDANPSKGTTHHHGGIGLPLTSQPTAQMLALTTSVSAFIGCLVYAGAISFSSPSTLRQSRLSDFGEAGAALSALPDMVGSDWDRR